MNNMDQGALGSCTANAIAYAYAFDEIKQHNAQFFMPSRLFIYYNIRVMEGTVNWDAGAMIRDGIVSINQTGVCPEPLWPYVISQFRTRPSTAAYTAATQAKALSYAALNFAGTVDTATRTVYLKNVLHNGVPFIFGFVVYESFESDITTRTGLMPMPGPREQLLGGHAVCCVGYNDRLGAFICKNSWGSGWGVGGYFYMPYPFMCGGSGTGTNPALTYTSDFWVVNTITRL